MSELDRTDRNILKMLQEDGRITTVELADKACRQRPPASASKDYSANIMCWAIARCSTPKSSASAYSFLSR